MTAGILVVNQLLCNARTLAHTHTKDRITYPASTTLTPFSKTEEREQCPDMCSGCTLIACIKFRLNLLTLFLLPVTGYKSYLFFFSILSTSPPDNGGAVAEIEVGGVGG